MVCKFLILFVLNTYNIIINIDDVVGPPMEKIKLNGTTFIKLKEFYMSTYMIYIRWTNSAICTAPTPQIEP